MNVCAKLAFVCLFAGFVLPVAGEAEPTVPDDRDRQVLEALLLHLLVDKDFDMTRVPTNGATIVLHARTPEKTGFLMSHQIRSEIRERTLPAGTETDVRRRNTPPRAPDTYDSVTAYYTNLTFHSGIVVADLTELWKRGRRSSISFPETYPKARGWLEPYLPGYSKDGMCAVVRAGVGPWVHGAMLTAVLEKTGDKWVVKWYQVAWFA
jgi:hypothetical protein